MVGDYPLIDIKGGKDSNMETVLVESGMYNRNDPEQVARQHQQYLKYADHIVGHVKDAVDVILSENGIC